MSGNPYEHMVEEASGATSRISRFSIPRITASETIDDRIVAFMRLLLTAAALLVILIDPSEPGQLVGITYMTALNNNTILTSQDSIKVNPK